MRQRLREARFPEVKTLDTCDFTAVEGVSATQIHALAHGPKPSSTTTRPRARASVSEIAAQRNSAIAEEKREVCDVSRPLGTPNGSDQGVLLLALLAVVGLAGLGVCVRPPARQLGPQSVAANGTSRTLPRLLKLRCWLHVVIATEDRDRSVGYHQPSSAWLARL